MTTKQIRHGWIAAGVILASVATVVPAKADVIPDLGVALGSLGFDVQGRRNYLSGGNDFLVTTNFPGSPLDFGVGDLTLQGPLSLQVSTGKRLIPTLDIDFSTAVNGLQSASPLGYVLNFDPGSQATQISGTLLVDGHLSLNGFGYYDLQVTYSSRQNAENDGRFSTERATDDLDVGPINISGNIYADILAAITDPIFKAAGADNPFEHFSASSKLQEYINNANTQIQSLGDLEASSRTAALPTVVAPEPSLLLLVAAGVPLIFSRRLMRAVRHS